MSSSIFSIEIFIDRIRILEGEKCIFPSTVLKLLDYEPALISTVEHDSQSKFREYIDFMEKSNEVKKITQLNELKDTDGNYVIRKGKSILFDGNTLTLIAEFNALPLYILICDDYFYPNHLIGVVTMKLSDLMINLAKKISTANHTVSEEIMGKFPIVNLMGNAVGFITLKLRLIFIGANLSPHLQEEQHIEIRTRSKVIDPVEKSVEFGDQIITEETKREEKILVRNIGCQVDKKRTIRIQVPDNNNNIVTNNNLGKVGLTIDPNDPVLVDYPPMIYNSYYGNREETDSEPEETKIQPIKTNPENPLSNIVVKSLNKSPETISILNELLNQLKSWKSQTDLDKKKPLENETPKKKSISNRSKKIVVKEEEEEQEEKPTPRKEDRKEFLKRISKPKKRSNSPVGIVPKEKGWLRKEREYSGPVRSRLEFKLTKTQVKRIELRNPTVFKKIIQQKQPKNDRNLSSSDFYTSPSHTPIPRLKRNPIVPPLFGSGTSISVPSFTMSAGTGESQQSEGNDENNKKTHKRPPQSPGKESFHLNNGNRNNNNNNYNSRSFSYDTNETVNEADQYLNLNPVQSNRSPHMSKRSNHVPAESEENSYDYNNRTDHSENSYASESFGNREVEDSDKYNQSFSTENEVAKSPSRRYSIASQISQTSEWRTDYSIESSNSQSNNSNNNKKESSNPSLNHGIQRFPVKVPINQRSSLQSNAGPGFLESVESGGYLTVEYERPSFNESLEVSNMDSFNLRNGYNESYSSRHSVDQNDENNSMLRPISVGADVTSFTKVTKYERSLLPGHMNSNYLGTHLITSTVGSLRTDDSQVLTSESYY